jgi:hypothetical protein
MDGATRHYGLLAFALAAAIAVVVWDLLVVRSDLRLLTVIAGGGTLLVLCLWHPQTTLLFMTAWLPFSGLIRRFFDQDARPAADPFLVLVPVISGALTVVAAWTYRDSALVSFRRSMTTWLATLLVLVLALEVFNPIQGDPLVGLGGTVFLFFPVLWFFLGRTYFDGALVHRMLSLVAVIGMVCALYGMSQTLFGFAAFEERWIASREFASLQIGHFIRPFSTFASPEEWSRYLMVAVTIGVGRWIQRPTRWWWLALAGVCALGLALSAVRISVFGLVVSIAALLTLAAPSRVAAIGRLAALAVVLTAYAWIAPSPSPAEDYASDVAWQAFFGHTSRGVLTPLAEESLWGRIETWGDLFGRVVPSYPLGMGLGVPTLGAWRFDPSVAIGTESYTGSIFVAAGFAGGALLLALFASIMHVGLKLGMSHPSDDLPIVAAVLVGILLTSVFANSLSLYAVGPLGWGLMGWLSTLEQERRMRPDRVRR